MASISTINNSDSGLSTRQKINILIALYNSIAVSDGSYNLQRLVASYVKSASPTGLYLKDDGTWSSVAQTLSNVLGYGNTTELKEIIANVAADENGFRVVGSVDGLDKIILFHNSDNSGRIIVLDSSEVEKIILDGQNGIVEAVDYIINSATANRLAYIDGAKKLNFLDTTTYPSLPEIANVKGVASPLQTQLDAKASITYVDGLVAGLLDDRGSYDASSNLFPSTGGSGVSGAILKGDIWYISVAGTLGGQVVTVGDSVRALFDTPGQTSTNWSVLETNIGYVPENVVNKATTMTGNTGSNVVYLTAKAIYDWAVATFQEIITDVTWGAFINGLTAKTTPVDADYDIIMDSADSDKAKKVSWANRKSELSSSALTFTNKRITQRTLSITSSATPTINTDSYDCVDITALAAAITSFTTNLSGTATNFQKLIIRIKDNGTARAITWGASFVALGAALPTTTVINKILTVGFIYDTTTSKWGCVASAQES